MAIKLISIVIPCFNESEVIIETINRLDKCLIDKKYQYEYIFVNDGSKDLTLKKLCTAKKQNKRIKIVNFARNFGHQLAVSAGIKFSSGDAIVLIDADLQDPPELIPSMIKKSEEGFDVVYGQRIVRQGESLFKKVTANLFYRIINLISEVPIPLDAGDFRLITRRVAEDLNNMPENSRFIRGMISWVGYDQCPILYERNKRFAGETKYPFKKMLHFAIDGILSFSIKPLRFSILFGSLISITAFLMALYAVFLRIETNNWVPGWTSIMIAILFIGGVQLLCIGIIGEYIGKIFYESKKRPLYIVKDFIGFD